MALVLTPLLACMPRLCSLCYRRMQWVCERLSARASGELPSSVHLPDRPHSSDPLTSSLTLVFLCCLACSNATDFDRKRHERMMREAREARGIGADTSGNR